MIEYTCGRLSFDINCVCRHVALAFSLDNVDFHFSPEAGKLLGTMSHSSSNLMKHCVSISFFFAFLFLGFGQY